MPHPPLSLSPSVCQSICLSVYLCLLISLSLSVCLCLSVCVSISLSLFLSVSVCLSLCLSLSLPECECVCVCVCACVCVCKCVCLSLSLCLSFSPLLYFFFVLPPGVVCLTSARLPWRCMSWVTRREVFDWTVGTSPTCPQSCVTPSACWRKSELYLSCCYVQGPPSVCERVSTSPLSYCPEVMLCG